METSSIFGVESDVGSNSDIFWFWSRRMQPPALYYARHVDLPNTRLKTPLSPHWLMAILSVNEINIAESTVYEYENTICVAQKYNSLGRNVIKVVAINKVNNFIAGHYLYRDDGTLIAMAEIKDYYFIDGIAVPKIVHIQWLAEQIDMTWELARPVVNGNLSPNLWKKPIHRQEVDLSKAYPFW
jgi:hypothetical protein